MERMDLKMHIGIGEQKSKTEAVFFPSRETMQIWIEDNKKTSLPSNFLPTIDPDAPKKINLPLKKMKVILNTCYEKSMNTINIIDDFGFTSFTKECKYLGYVDSYNLDDNADISFRVKKTS